MGSGKLGSMYGELTSISNMGSGQDSKPGPCVHQAQTLTPAPSYYPCIVRDIFLMSSVQFYFSARAVPIFIVSAVADSLLELFSLSEWIPHQYDESVSGDYLSMMNLYYKCLLHHRGVH